MTDIYFCQDIMALYFWQAVKQAEVAYRQIVEDSKKKEQPEISVFWKAEADIFSWGFFSYRIIKSI